MSVASIAARRKRLIRKALDAAVAIADEDVAAITSITETAQATLKPLPTGWHPLGSHTKEEGLNWTREIENSDTNSHGSQEPTRRDIVGDVRGLTVIAQETRLKTLELFNSVDLSEVTPDATTGEIQFSPPSAPQVKNYRVLTVAQDGAGDDLIYFARFLPRASITETAEQAWNDSTELRYELTFTAYTDDVLGYSIREFWGGPGLAALLGDMGWDES